MRLIIVIAVIVIIAFVQSYGLKMEIPSVANEEATQWLSTRDIPRRWRQQYSNNQLSDEFARTLYRLELHNENGVRQFDMKSIDGIEMETLHELRKMERAG
jgi:hypothetical protein